jgi:hypothetical protein
MPKRPIPKTKPASRPARLTIIQLEDWIRENMPPGISRDTIYAQLRRGGVKIAADHTVDLQEFLTAYAGAKERDNRYLGPETGTGADPRRMKLVLECAMLKLKLDQMKGELVPIQEHQAAIREMAGWVRDAHAQFIADVKVLTGDAKVVADAERLRDNLFARLREKAAEGGEG